jgi:hypothetical protein
MSPIIRWCLATMVSAGCATQSAAADVPADDEPSLIDAARKDSPVVDDVPVAIDVPAVRDVPPSIDAPDVRDVPPAVDVSPRIDTPPVADLPPVVDAPPAVDAGCVQLPPAWPARWTLAAANPMLVATATDPLHGSDNVYAPDLQRVDGGWAMFYGAQGGDGHDRIYVATSRDGAAWRKWPSDAAPRPVLDRGTSNHVNDPSVVRANGRWSMFYTDAPTAENDRIWLAQSDTLTGFARVGEVLGPGPAGAWDDEKVGRPSVHFDGATWWMFYDGTARGRRHVGLATSTDGRTFTRHPRNPLVLDAGAVDVQRVGGVWVMLREGGAGTYWSTSPDGLCWVDRGLLFGLSGGSYDRFGQVTPHLQVVDGAPVAVWFGGASVASWDRNRIAVAHADGAPAGGGCTACLGAGLSCAAACQSAIGPTGGVCGMPGSTDPSRCCACAPEGCERCIGSAPDCHAACVSAGGAGGWCATPGSTDGSHCCACW